MIQSSQSITMPLFADSLNNLHVADISENKILACIGAWESAQLFLGVRRERLKLILCDWLSGMAVRGWVPDGTRWGWRDGGGGLKHKILRRINAPLDTVKEGRIENSDGAHTPDWWKKPVRMMCRNQTFLKGHWKSESGLYKNYFPQIVHFHRKLSYFLG